MQIPCQPPPDAPAPPPGEEAARSRTWMKGIICLGVLSALLLVVLAYASAPRVPPGKNRRDRINALNNARLVGLALFEFDAEYGRFPDASTISAVKAATGTKLTLDSSSSNKLFRQLIASGLHSEKPYWARTTLTPRNPDEIFHTDATALQPGECSFAYIAGLSASDDPETPVIMTSLLKGKTTFDRLSFHGQAVVLFLDNSARPLMIQEDGRVMLNGMDIFDPRQRFWKGKVPDIKWPE